MLLEVYKSPLTFYLKPECQHLGWFMQQNTANDHNWDPQTTILTISKLPGYQ